MTDKEKLDQYLDGSMRGIKMRTWQYQRDIIVDECCNQIANMASSAATHMWWSNEAHEQIIEKVLTTHTLFAACSNNFDQFLEVMNGVLNKLNIPNAIDLRTRLARLAGQRRGEINHYILTGVTHVLSNETVASGAGRGVCSCGWKSEVSDDGLMYHPDYYSPTDRQRDFEQHLTEVLAQEVPKHD